MADQDCINFLKWALPKIQLRWQGFRKVRRQVCKRIQKRFTILGLKNFTEYKKYLQIHSQEWNILDSFCYITISRFYRDKLLFDKLSSEILPAIARNVVAEEKSVIRCWSAGCCCGEEPYTLLLIWKIIVESSLKTDLQFTIIATDRNTKLLKRAEEAKYRHSSLSHLPNTVITKAFEKIDDLYRLNDQYRGQIEFIPQDIRKETPGGLFHIIFCRNLAFTYFNENLQNMILERITRKILPEGFLIIGAHESLPPHQKAFIPYQRMNTIYQKS